MQRLRAADPAYSMEKTWLLIQLLLYTVYCIHSIYILCTVYCCMAYSRVQYCCTYSIMLLYCCCEYDRVYFIKYSTQYTESYIYCMYCTVPFLVLCPVSGAGQTVRQQFRHLNLFENMEEINHH